MAISQMSVNLILSMITNTKISRGVLTGDVTYLCLNFPNDSIWTWLFG